MSVEAGADANLANVRLAPVWSGPVLERWDSTFAGIGDYFSAPGDVGRMRLQAMMLEFTPGGIVASTAGLMTWMPVKARALSPG